MKSFSKHLWMHLSVSKNSAAIRQWKHGLLKSPWTTQNLISEKDAKKIYNFFEEINDIFGIIDFKKVNRAIPTKIKQLVLAREKYRKNQEWQKADQMRQEIEKQGFTIEDTKDGPVAKAITWFYNYGV